MSREPEVAVAVVSWNTRELLARCLEGLRPDAEAGRAEVWVVDNASSDGSPELVRAAFPWARLLAQEENLGFGRAVNLVARRTRTPWLACANADVAPSPGALAALLEAGAQDPGAGAVAPRLVLPDGSTQHSVFAFPTLAFTGLFATGAAELVGDRLVLPGRWDPERARRVPWAIAAFLLLRREAFDAAGGFDERQWMYAEDLELGWRLREAGWATRFEPRARVAHESGAATRQRFGEDLDPRWQEETYAALARRRGPAYARAVAFVNTAGALLRGRRRWAGIHARALRDPGPPCG